MNGSTRRIPRKNEDRQHFSIPASRRRFDRCRAPQAAESRLRERLGIAADGLRKLLCDVWRNYRLPLMAFETFWTQRVRQIGSGYSIADHPSSPSSSPAATTAQ